MNATWAVNIASRDDNDSVCASAFRHHPILRFSLLFGTALCRSHAQGSGGKTRSYWDELLIKDLLARRTVVGSEDVYHYGVQLLSAVGLVLHATVARFLLVAPVLLNSNNGRGVT